MIMGTFGERLRAAMDERGPFCVGIDPHPGLLTAWGLDDDAAGLERFSRTVVEAVGDTVAMLKPQSAFFERHGSRGIAVLETVIAEARAAGALVVLDVKRGDIGSTMQAYADAYADPSSPLAADAVTASPFLGFESLRPLLDTALAHGNGVFVLALTSNPEGPEVQHAHGPDGRTVAGTILDHVRAANAVEMGSAASAATAGAVAGAGSATGAGGAGSAAGAGGAGGARGARGARGAAGGDRSLGSVGVVVGVTNGPTTENLHVGGPLLALGIGAQGAAVGDLPAVFGDALPQVVPAVSRGVLQAGPDRAALRRAATDYVQTVRDLLFRAERTV